MIGKMKSFSLERPDYGKYILILIHKDDDNLEYKKCSDCNTFNWVLSKNSIICKKCGKKVYLWEASLVKAKWYYLGGEINGKEDFRR